MLHRLFYAWLVAPVPAWKPGGLTIDHKCRRRNCANPLHLELVPHKVNMERSAVCGPRVSACKNGHPYDTQNTRYKTNGARYCGHCHTLNDFRHRQKMREERLKKPKVIATHCQRGHEFSADNTKLDYRGHRHCKTCLFQSAQRRKPYNVEANRAAAKRYRDKIYNDPVRHAALKAEQARRKREAKRTAQDEARRRSRNAGRLD